MFKNILDKLTPKNANQKILDNLLKDIEALRSSHIASDRMRRSLEKLYEEQRIKEKRLKSMTNVLVDILGEKSYDIKNDLQKYINTIGEASEYDRCYIYINQSDIKEFHLFCEWNNAKTCCSKEINNQTQIKYDDFDNALQQLNQKKPVYGLVQNLINSKDSNLFDDACSFLIVPIFTNGALWGFLGLEDISEKEPSNDDRDIFFMMASIIGATIKKQDLKQLNEQMLHASGGYIWYKDSQHRYFLCDPKFCIDFFGFTPDNAYAIKGKSDLELIEYYRQNIGFHAFGELCLSTDDHSKLQRCQSRYIEIGYIDKSVKDPNSDKSLFILDVIKTPIFDKKGNYTGNIGFARPVNTIGIEKIISDQIHQGVIEILYSSENTRVYWIREDLIDDITSMDIDIFPK